jgi:DNA polymerase-3 subunit delta'
MKIEHDNHEDVIYLRKEDRIIKVKQIEALQKSLSVRPHTAGRITAIVEEADKMNPQSQNKLLKTLEEPAPGYIIILITDNPEQLLDTIKSRCVLINTGVLINSRENTMESHATTLIEKLQRGDPYYDITNYVDSVVKEKEDCLELLYSLEIELNTILKLCAENGDITPDLALGVSQIMSMIGETRRDLSLNISHKYAMRNLLICIGEIMS